MAAKKNFVLRIDEKTYAALEKWAADEFRSVNVQIEWLLHRPLRDAGRLPKNQPDEPETPSEPQ